MGDLWKEMEDQMEHIRTVLETFWGGLVSFFPHLLSAVLILLLGLAASRLLPRPVNAMLKHTTMDPVAVKYLLRVLRITTWSLVVVMALDKLGVPVGSLLAVLAAWARPSPWPFGKICPTWRRAWCCCLPNPSRPGISSRWTACPEPSRKSS